MSSKPPEPSERTAGSAGFFTIFPSIVLPMFLAVVDQTIVATALPAIAGDLGGVERVSWVVIAYLVATTIAAPVYGRLGDLVGRRRLMFVALAVFMASSLACAFATSIEMLTVTRILQGFGGGGLMTLSQAMIGETVPPRERARYQGYLATVIVSSSACGPVIGGILTDLFGWRSVFLVNLPVGILAVFLVTRLPAKAGSGEAFRFDFAGLLFFSAFVVSLLVMVEQARGLDAGAILPALALLGVAVLSIVLLIWRERRASSPLLPIPLLSNPSIWRADALAACHGASLVSLLTFLPIYMLAVHGVSAAQIGVMLLPFTIGIGVGSVVTGRIVSRTGRTAVFPSWGLIAVVALLLVLAFRSAAFDIMTLAAVLGLISFFMGTVMGVVQLTVQTASGAKMLGAGAASVQFSRSLGAAVGTALVGTILFSTLSAADPQAAHLFQMVMEQGPDVLDEFDESQRALLQHRMAGAFQAAFLGIAGFASIAAILAWTIPLRRI